MYTLCLLSHNLAFYVIILTFYLTVFAYNYGLVCTLSVLSRNLAFYVIILTFYLTVFAYNYELVCTLSVYCLII